MEISKMANEMVRARFYTLTVLNTKEAGRIISRAEWYEMKFQLRCGDYGGLKFLLNLNKGQIQQ
jgi:hypothetical protein